MYDMDKKKVNDLLIDQLSAFKGRFENAVSEHEIEMLLNEVCNCVQRDFGETIALNIKNIIGHSLIQNKVGVSEVIEYLEGSLMKKFDDWTADRENNDGFDEKYGTRTSQIWHQYELPEKVTIERFASAARYNPSPISSVHQALKVLPDFGISYEEFVFIDVGAGLGRNLLLASNYPFKRIIGIELSSHLVGIAVENMEIYQARTSGRFPFEMICVNALDYSFPQENLVMYFWDPFASEVVQQFMNKIRAFLIETRLKVVLIFLGPVFREVKYSPFFRLLCEFDAPDFVSRDRPFRISIFNGLPV